MAFLRSAGRRVLTRRFAVDRRPNQRRPGTARLRGLPGACRHGKLQVREIGRGRSATTASLRQKHPTQRPRDAASSRRRKVTAELACSDRIVSTIARTPGTSGTIGQRRQHRLTAQLAMAQDHASGQGIFPLVFKHSSGMSRSSSTRPWTIVSSTMRGTSSGRTRPYQICCG